jgi:Spy/CpxP family protein refolding chaperone
MSKQDKTADQPRSTTGMGRRRLAGLAALGGLALVSLKAHAQGMGGWGRSRSRDPQEMARRLEHGISHMIRELGGTTEQKDKLVAIAMAALTDAQPLRDQLREARRKGLSLLAAATIDKAALEQLRATQLQAMDGLSKRLLQSMTDSAEVLTPEQRIKLSERMQRRMERHRR